MEYLEYVGNLTWEGEILQLFNPQNVLASHSQRHDDSNPENIYMPGIPAYEPSEHF